MAPIRNGSIAGISGSAISCRAASKVCWWTRRATCLSWSLCGVESCASRTRRRHERVGVEQLSRNSRIAGDTGLARCAVGAQPLRSLSRNSTSGLPPIRRGRSESTLAVVRRDRSDLPGQSRISQADRPRGARQVSGECPVRTGPSYPTVCRRGAHAGRRRLSVRLGALLDRSHREAYQTAVYLLWRAANEPLQTVAIRFRISPSRISKFSATWRTANSLRRKSKRSKRAKSRTDPILTS